MSDCHVLPGWPATCNKGTVGCDACEFCVCHSCYGHREDKGCTCGETT